MRHIFDHRYSVLEGRHPDGSPRMVERLRCSRCGMGQGWGGADDPCIGHGAIYNHCAQAQAKLRYKQRRELGLPPAHRGKPVTGPDGVRYESLVDLCRGLRIPYDTLRRRVSDGMSPLRAAQMAVDSRSQRVVYGKKTAGPDGVEYPSARAMIDAHGAPYDVIRGLSRKHKITLAEAVVRWRGRFAKEAAE